MLARGWIYFRRRLNKRKAICFTVVLMICIFYWNYRQIPPDKVTLPENVDRSNNQFLQPVVTKDFPVDSSDTIKIPHILHQTYRHTCIINHLEDFVTSFVFNNPTWQYYFWTDESARKLIENRHPYLLHLWDNVSRGVKRGDILRYVVLYEFGGVYADLDVENVRPLDRATLQYSCIFPPEPIEHSVFLYNEPYIINNGVILCRAKHPFLKQLLDNIATQDPTAGVIESTGPLFVTNQFKEYYNLADKPFNVRRASSEEDNSPLANLYDISEPNGVYVSNTHYFTDDIDIPFWGWKFNIICQDFHKQTELIQRSCIELESKGLYRFNRKYAFTKHHWFHTWSRHFSNLFGFIYWFQPCTEIMDIVPNALIYGQQS